MAVSQAGDKMHHPYCYLVVRQMRYCASQRRCVDAKLFICDSARWPRMYRANSLNERVEIRNPLCRSHRLRNRVCLDGSSVQEDG